jgi:hypothetical protein
MKRALIVAGLAVVLAGCQKWEVREQKRENCRDEGRTLRRHR